MDNSFIFWPKHVDFEYFSTRLNNLHPAVKYTFEMAKLIQSDRSQPYQVFKFLDIEVILHSDNTVESDIYYRDTNAHDYLPYNSAHPKHCKDNQLLFNRFIMQNYEIQPPLQIVRKIFLLLQLIMEI